jgi:hypothetical protein
MSITLKENSKIYLVCPANFATGGTEVIHQLAYKLNSLGFKYVYLNYINANHTDPVHYSFKKYKIHYTDQVEDHIDNLLIVSEIHTDVLFQYKSIQKSIWWLSVDNYLIKKLNTSFSHLLKKLIIKRQFSIPKKMFNFMKKNDNEIFHFYQSEYARQFLEKNGVTSNYAYLSDYLSSTFFNNQPIEFTIEKREDIIVYNPLKGLEFTQKLISLKPKLQWIPIQKMTPEQVRLLLSKSKVYIDFGHHPGKDRLPREAAISGCCIITGKKGSAGNQIDINFSEDYKFDEKSDSPVSILDKIEFCLTNYPKAIKDFSEYRKKIATEEKLFEQSISNIFNKNNDYSRK